MKQNVSRRQFLKGLGYGTAALSISNAFSPWSYAQDPIVIGMPLALTGPIQFFGLSALRSAQLAVQEINEAGGVDGRLFSIETEDSQGNAAQSPIALQAVAERSHVMSGLFTSEETLAALPSLATIRKPFMSTGAATPLTTLQVGQAYDNLKYYFRNGPLNSVDLIKEMLLFADEFLVKTLGWESVALLGEDAAFADPIFEGLAALGIAPLSDAFASVGLSTVETIRYALNTTDFSGIFSQIADSGADGIFTIISFTGVAPTIQWAELRPPQPLVGINVQAQTGAFNQLTGGSAESVTTITTATRALITDKTIPFFDKFAAFSPDLPIPGYTGPTTYDAVYILKDAIEAAGTLDGDALVTALEATDFTGVVGRIQFYPPGVGPFTHDLIRDNLQTGQPNVRGPWIQWQDGVQKVLFPFELSFGDTGGSFVLPPWLRVS